MIKVSGMTVTGLRTTMTSPTVPPSSQHQQQQKSMSRLSNFSVASLLADTRPKSPSEPLDMIMPVATQTTPGSSPPRAAEHPHHHLLFHPGAHPAFNKSLPLPSPPPSQPELHHNNNNDMSAITTKNERHTPHSSAESDNEYDGSNLEDDEEDIDIEDVNNEDSCSTPDLDSKSPLGGSGLSSSSPQMLSSPTSAAAAAAIAAGHVPIRPTPFSALAAAAATWGGMGGSMPWAAAAAAAAGRQMQPFGPPGLFPGQGFGPGGGEFRFHFYLKIVEGN